jgi:histidyl-tRNA synthetase
VLSKGGVKPAPNSKLIFLSWRGCAAVSPATYFPLICKNFKELIRGRAKKQKIMPRKIKKLKEKNKKTKPELPGGFRDYLPEDQITREKIISKIKKTFEDFGFDPMETPAVERTETLAGKEKETSKIIFNVKSSEEKKSDASLRFDLTSPLARVVAANPDIPKPFKRYQIGASWRGERPQEGRYREFLQADIDIVGASSTMADSEIVLVIYKTFKNLGINKLLIKINNRKVLNALPKYAGFPESKLAETLRIIDKTDKIGLAAVEKELAKLLKKSAKRVLEFITISGDAKTKLQKAMELVGKIPPADEGIKELVEITRNLNASGVEKENWEINFSTVRGLGYYTGPVFETILTAIPEIGSVFSGGRYDNLMERFTANSLPAVGASLGFDRLFAALKKLGMIKPKLTLTKVLIFDISPDLRNDYLRLADTLRSEGVNTAIYLGEDKAFQAQLAYAVKKEIPFILIYGAEENKRRVVQIKNLATKEQKEIREDNLVNYFK